MNKTSKFSPEVRERAVRMVQEHRGEYPSLWAAVESIAPKIGCVPQTLLDWVKRHEIDAGTRAGTSSAEAQRVKDLEREVQELRRANEILNLASAFFAQAELDRALQHIAGGDLTYRVGASASTEGLLGELQRTQQRLQDLVREVRDSTSSIHTASAEIATGSQDLSMRTEQTASSLQETASSITQLTEAVRHSADAARQASELAASATEVAQRGGEVVSQVVCTMGEINQSSQKIADIIGVIDGIAFQTNILALNAAVEAARAGEQGRGFAVVASEVRSLAQRSATAAKEIKTLISASVDKVESGASLVADAGQTMSEIVASVQRVTDIVGEISHSSQEQSEGISQVNKAISQLDQMTQQNAALVEESAAAAESLKDQGVRLAEVVGTFRL